ncbi:pheromone processing endoprotease [Dipsacomyces acuminosporus]|nr:pheromone processing endoprotease [Dipsacomyces acuminosporus]
MKVRLLGLAALYLQASTVLCASNDAVEYRRALKVRSWQELSVQDTTQPVPSLQSDPSYEYTAVKFTSAAEDLVDVLAGKYASLTGWEHVGPLGSLPKYRVFRQKKGTGSKSRFSKRHSPSASSSEQITRDLGIEAVSPLKPHKRLYKRALVGDEGAKRQGPKGFGDGSGRGNATQWRDIKDPMYAQQWHLVNSVEHGHDINITGVWHQGVTGVGVTVALIDDGLDYTSEDLLDNFDFRGSYDFNDKTKLPTPRLNDDYHGTRCAGQIAATRNDVCGVGVAYGAKVAGIRMLSGQISDQEEIAALNYAMDSNWIYSCSWGPNDDGRTVQGPDKPIFDAFVNGIENGRGGLGSIFVFATGNGGGANDNCNFDGYTNSIYTISIGAIDHLDKHPYYSEMCSAQLAVTYSNGDNRGIVTTDVGVRACTTKHGGTSAAAPLAAGIFALALSVRPDLTWRDAQHLAVRTAIPVDTSDSDWADVASGRKYNHKYGFGKMDAGRIVDAARTFEHVGKQTKIELSKQDVNERIPKLSDRNGRSESVARSVEITKEQVEKAKMKRVEHVTVKVNIDHEFRGNIEVWLESPHGVRSQLAAVRPRDDSRSGLTDWTFMSVKHWDEDPVGKWTLKVRNAYLPNYSGTVKSWQLSVFGESTEKEPEHKVPKIDDSLPLPPSRPALPSPAPSDSNKSKGKEKVGDHDSSAVTPTQGYVRKSVAALTSGGFFILGAILSALGVLVLMRRRERKLASRQWTQFDTLGGGSSSNNHEEVFGREPEDIEDEDVYEFEDVNATVTSHSDGLQFKHTDDNDNFDNFDEDALTDDRTHGNSSKGSGETDENARLV